MRERASSSSQRQSFPSKPKRAPFVPDSFKKRIIKLSESRTSRNARIDHPSTLTGSNFTKISMILDGYKDKLKLYLKHKNGSKQKTVIQIGDLGLSGRQRKRADLSKNANKLSLLQQLRSARSHKKKKRTRTKSRSKSKSKSNSQSKSKSKSRSRAPRILNKKKRNSRIKSVLSRKKSRTSAKTHKSTNRANAFSNYKIEEMVSRPHFNKAALEQEIRKKLGVTGSLASFFKESARHLNKGSIDYRSIIKAHKHGKNLKMINRKSQHIKSGKMSLTDFASLKKYAEQKGWHKNNVVDEAIQVNHSKQNSEVQLLKQLKRMKRGGCFSQNFDRKSEDFGKTSVSKNKRKKATNYSHEKTLKRRVTSEFSIPNNYQDNPLIRKSSGSGMLATLKASNEVLDTFGAAKTASRRKQKRGVKGSIFKNNLQSNATEQAGQSDSSIHCFDDEDDFNYEEDNVFEEMIKKEKIESLSVSKIEERQSEIKWRMRAILIDWISEVCADYQLVRETFYYACKYVDQYLQRSRDIQKNEFQLLGLAAIFLASKMEETSMPAISDFCDFSSGMFKEEELLKMELTISKVVRKSNLSESNGECDQLHYFNG